jgi:hypothetical protein
MKDLSLRISRFHNNKIQTLGVIQEIENYTPIKVLSCLELPDLQNQSEISRIPYGFYNVEKRWSEHLKHHFHIKDVRGRSLILIHSGNYHSQILGCVLVGKSFKDINKDGQLDVSASRNALDELLAMMPDKFKLEIDLT